MALKNYGVLKGKAKDFALDDDASPHIELLLEADEVKHRVAINVRSKIAPHDLLYLKREPFLHPVTRALHSLPQGLTDIRDQHPNLALDYVRGQLFSREEMEVAPFTRVGPHNDLRDFIEPLIQRGLEDPNLSFYAFGEAWGPEISSPDRYFGFSPGRGIHDIHMNQGSSGRFRSTNGSRQDGALIVHFEEEDRWVAVFLAFQSQSWDTDPATGEPQGTDVPRTEPRSQPRRSSVAIVAAMVNPYGEERGQESVTLLNRSDASVDLEGWRLEDRSHRSQVLVGRIGPGDTLKVVVNPTVQLGNKGGEIRLLSPEGAVTDRVSYHKSQVAQEGWTTIF
ncbi:MAG: DUF2278 family protein [Myxococcales bacterium]|nr:DUF2278 family protein [Myxococcales bacterium]